MADAALNLRLARPLVEFARARGGADAIASLASAAGLDPAELDRSTVWVSVRQFEALLATVRAMVGTDEEFLDACAHRMVEGYGPLRFVVQAATPAAVFRQAARNFHVVSRISTLEITEARPGRIEVRYATKEPEGRLLCLSRQAQMMAAPTLWGLPRARLAERSCVARGDDACVYALDLYQRRRFLPVLLGGLAGAAGALVLSMASAELPWSPLLVGVGLLLGYAYELRRTNLQNLAIGEAANDALRKLVRDEAEARLEIVALNLRQRQWTQLLEEQLNERNLASQDLVERIRRASEARDLTLREVSHDLGSPLTVLLGHTELLAFDGADPGSIRNMTAAIEHMRVLLRDLMGTLKGSGVSFDHEALEMRDVAESLKGRLKALVFGRDIRVSVFRSREAPDAIKCNRILFDRVVDNLLSNAAKYTSSGSIVMEVGGTPGHLTLKLSDSGRGISPEQLEHIFHPGGSEESARAPGSFGVGLSVVVHLLGRIGGRLEVMSKPDLGTTFWAHFPVEPRIERPSDPGAEPRVELAKVLTIRKSVER